MPASAQTAVDQAFLQAVRDKGVPIASDAQALDLAHSTCGVLSNGGSAADALSKIASATHWSSDQAANFGSLAVVAYCKDKMPQVNAPQQEQPQATPAKPRMNVPSTTEEPSPTPKPPPHYPYGPRFGPQDSSPFS
jgi:hypothetical protein